MIAVTYGLARFAYGLFLPEMRESLDLSETVLGLIGAGSYAGYCCAILVALVFTSRSGPRFMAVAAGAVAVVGMATVAGAPTAWVLALGILVAGSSSGLASPPMGEAVATSIRVELQDRANALINAGTSIGVALSGPAALLLRAVWASRRRPRGNSSTAIFNGEAFSGHPRSPFWASSRICTWATHIKVGRGSRKFTGGRGSEFR
jgi:MFS family permease